MARQLESDLVLGRLAVEGVRRLRARFVNGCPVLRQTGGLYLGHEHDHVRGRQWISQLAAHDVAAELLPVVEARKRFPFLCMFEFDFAIFCPTDGVVDIHALLTDLLREARDGGFDTLTNCAVESFVMEGGVVRGVRTSRGEIRARMVIDATGAWSGRMGRTTPLPLKCYRRHLFFGGEPGIIPRDAPLVWDLHAGYYVRTEGVGLLMCPCDESEHPPGIPSVDSDVTDLLADKLLRYAPGLSAVALRRNWACLRTFAPDRRPVIGWDPGTRGLFHVSGLGGFGVTTSLAVGEVAASVINNAALSWVDVSCFGAGRTALRS
jgi:D-arginine dehydrogenase